MKVVIIGAGPAGLTAANEILKDKNYQVEILEESDYIGGISRTIEYNGNRMDIGGHRFFSKDEKVMNYWKELMLPQNKPAYDDKILELEKNFDLQGLDPEKNENVLLLRRRVSRILYRRKFFDYPITINMETLKKMGLKTTIKAGFSYCKSMIFKRRENSLEDFYINRFGKVLYEMFFEDYTEKVWGRSPKYISADWGKQRVKGVSILEIIKNAISKNKKNVETSLIEEFWYPKYGPGQLWGVLSKKVEEKGGKILKKHRVEKINVENNKIVSVVCNINSEMKEITGDIFISSMPIKDLINGMNGKIVPENILDIANGLPYRDFITVGLLVKKLNLKNETKLKTINNIVPDCWMYIQEPDVKIGRLQIFNNWSPYLVKDIENTVWIGLEYFSQENDEYWNMSENEFIEFAIDELVKIGIIQKDDVMDSHQEKIKKAYPAYFDTYSQINHVIEFLNGFENLYCIGRNGQHRYNNMDHSMLTAIRAAEIIKNGNKDKSDIWKVNTEKVYHEKK